MLLAKIKELQRLEIENYTQELESISSSSNLLPFGYDIFSSPGTKFNNYGAPIPSGYRVAGDLIEIQLFGQKNQAYSLEISREGIIQFPDIGPINAFEKGTSFIDLKNLLKRKFSKTSEKEYRAPLPWGLFVASGFLFLERWKSRGR